MSTRSRIGYTKNGYVHSAYHHWDGYPEGVGAYLVKYFNTKEKVEALVAGGDMSSCMDPRGGTSEKWEDVKPQVDDCVESYSEEMLPENLRFDKGMPSMIAYMYCFMRGKYPNYDGDWYVSENGIDWEKVVDEIAYRKQKSA